MEFQFVRQGTLYSVHTEVGNGPAAVKVEARELPQQPALEPSDEVA